MPGTLLAAEDRAEGKTHPCGARWGHRRKSKAGRSSGPTGEMGGEVTGSTEAGGPARRNAELFSPTRERWGRKEPGGAGSWDVTPAPTQQDNFQELPSGRVSSVKWHLRSLETSRCHLHTPGSKTSLCQFLDKGVGGEGSNCWGETGGLACRGSEVHVAARARPDLGHSLRTIGKPCLTHLSQLTLLLGITGNTQISHSY